MLRYVFALLVCVSSAAAGEYDLNSAQDKRAAYDLMSAVAGRADYGLMTTKAVEDCRIVPNCKCGCTDGEVCRCLSKKPEEPAKPVKPEELAELPKPTPAATPVSTPVSTPQTPTYQQPMYQQPTYQQPTYQPPVYYYYPTYPSYNTPQVPYYGGSCLPGG